VYFQLWIYVVSGCIAHLPLTGSTVPVCVDPSAGGHIVAGPAGLYVHVGLSNVPPTPTGGAAVHAVTNAALLPVAVQLPLASGVVDVGAVVPTF
jgi:hypothetical protein